MIGSRVHNIVKKGVNMMMKREIDKLAWLHIQDKQLLVARSRGQDTYYIPGGKRELGESDQQALVREIKEELSVDLVAGTIRPAGIFTAPAHGKPEGTVVKMSCYFGDFTGEIAAASEIEEVTWLSPANEMRCSAATRMIIDWLRAEGLIESFGRGVASEAVTASASESTGLETYKWILFDADNTLFHFDDFRGLQLMFSRLGVDFTKTDHQDYHAINKPLWTEYQDGKITAQELQHRRFIAWADKLGTSAIDLNNQFLAAMAETCPPLDGAVSLLTALRGKAKVGIITNGFIALHQARLEYTGLKDHIDLLVVSEEVGIAKPDKRIFDHAFARMGHPAREHVLMVGDTPESDIRGGINAGIDTCWLNVTRKPAPEGIVPRYEVSSLAELESFLLRRAPAADMSGGAVAAAGAAYAESMTTSVWMGHAATTLDTTPSPQ